MINIKKTSQTRSKKEDVRIIGDKLCPSKGMNQLKLDLWLDDLVCCEIGDLFFHDTNKWAEFQDRYMDEFEDKIELMNDILAKKKDRVKVTWISIFNRKI